MKEFLLCAAMILALSSCKKDASREVVLAETPTGQQFHFMPIYENGVTDITITIAWPMQWAYEPTENPATPYVAVDAIFQGGTNSMAPQEVMEAFNDMNTGGRLYVTASHAVGEISFPKEHVEDVIAISSEILAAPQFDSVSVQRAKQGFLTTIQQSHSQTANQMWAAARMAVLGDGPLNDFLSIPNPDSINAVQLVDLQRWHKETIVQQGVTIVVTGAITRKKAGQVIDQILAGLPDEPTPQAPTVQANFNPKVILLHLPDAEKSTLGFVGQLPPNSEGGDLTDLLALNVFAQSGGSPLFDAVRTTLRASYGFQAGYTNYDRDIRVMIIGGEVETSKLAEAAELVQSTYQAYKTKPDLTSFEDLKTSIADGTVQNVQYVDVAARTILELVLDGRDPTDVTRVGELIENIEENDIQERLLSAFPSGKDLIVVAASPDDNVLPGACVVTSIKQVVEKCQ